MWQFPLRKSLHECEARMMQMRQNPGGCSGVNCPNSKPSAPLVSKKRDQPYRSGKNVGWIKVKTAELARLEPRPLGDG